MSLAGAMLATMKARFKGGALDGRAFDIPRRDVPPRGLDVAHAGRVLRYGLGRALDGEAVYDFATERGTLRNSTMVIDLGGAFTAVPLRYYPRRR